MLGISNSSQESDLFSLDDHLLSDEAESNRPDDLFASNSGSGITDDLFLNDVSSNLDEMSLTGSIPDDFQIADSDLLSPPNDPECSWSPSSSNRLRAREGPFCRQDSATKNAPPRYLEVKTDDDVKKYWCSETSIVGFANLPVCNRATILPSSPSWFVTLALCRLSKLV